MQNYGKIKKRENKVLLLPCGRVFEIESPEKDTNIDLKNV